MKAPDAATVRAYYDARVGGKIRDFIDANPRIEAAVELIAEWAPPCPRRVLEIGCGIGATSWRMARAWPGAEVVGIDISAGSIAIARRCFSRPNLRYVSGTLEPGALTGSFDVVVLMDVYEHIYPAQLPGLHEAIQRLLSDSARIVITVPTPATQRHARMFMPEELQPVDEGITTENLLRLGADTGTCLVFLREVGIWRYGDYLHAVLARFPERIEVAARRHRASGLRAKAIRLVKGLAAADGASSDYLGTDVLRDKPRDATKRFRVSKQTRIRLVRPVMLECSPAQ